MTTSVVTCSVEDEVEPLYSLIIPVYKNEDNIPPLIEALTELSKQFDKFEVIFVDDGSPDASGRILLNLQPDLPFDSSVVFHSRNFGSFIAVRTGMEYAIGKYIAVMAADLQEPPELVVDMFNLLNLDEADIVFGQRTARDDAFLKRHLSNIFWAFYRKLVVKDVPKGGVDIFACNRKVLDALLDMQEKNSALVAQLFWVGFRRAFVPYERRKREIGTSAWGFRRRLRYMTDSIFAFSDLPIHIILWIGLIGCVTSVSFGMLVLIGRISGLIQSPGYAATILFLSFAISILLLVQGIIGLYIWRAYENTKDRPIRVIANVVQNNKSA